MWNSVQEVAEQPNTEKESSRARMRNWNENAYAISSLFHFCSGHARTKRRRKKMVVTYNVPLFLNVTATHLFVFVTFPVDAAVGLPTPTAASTHICSLFSRTHRCTSIDYGINLRFCQEQALGQEHRVYY
jgi:hypothetical protein